ncbi:MAG: hypothetical protein WA816_03855 [Bacteroidales bacterium]
MEKIKEKREFSIDNKIFTREDVLELIKLFGIFSNEILKKSKEIKLRDLIQEGWKETDITERDLDTSYSNLEFTFYGNSTYSGTLVDISDDIFIPADKKIVEINFCFSERQLDSNFRIKIGHSDSDSYASSSYVSVEGQDRIWVNETIKRVVDFILNCKNQSVFAKKFQILIIVSTILTLNFFLLNLIKLFIKINHLFPKIVNNWFTRYLILFAIVSTLITAMPAVFISGWFKKLFPRIEIQTGKDFQQIKNEKRKKCLIIISIIIIPTIISFLLRLLIH